MLVFLVFLILLVLLVLILILIFILFLFPVLVFVLLFLVLLLLRRFSALTQIQLLEQLIYFRCTFEPRDLGNEAKRSGSSR